MKTKNKKLTEEQIKQAADTVAWEERTTGVFKNSNPNETIPVTILSKRTRGRSGHAYILASEFKLLYGLGLVAQGHIDTERVSTAELRSMALDAQAIWLLAETRTQYGIECAQALVKDDRISHNRAQMVLTSLWMQENGKQTLDRRMIP